MWRRIRSSSQIPALIDSLSKKFTYEKSSQRYPLNGSGQYNLEFRKDSFNDVLISLIMGHETARLDCAVKIPGRKPLLKLLNPSSLEGCFNLLLLALSRSSDENKTTKRIPLGKLLDKACNTEIISNYEELKRDSDKLLSCYWFKHTSYPIHVNDHTRNMIGKSIHLLKNYGINTSTLHNWLNSIASESIKQACFALEGETLPDFLVTDILLRTPRSNYEFDLLIDLFLDPNYQIIESDKKSTLVLNNLIQNCHHRTSSRLLEIINKVLDQTSNEPFLNNLVWSISRISSKVPRDESLYFNILECQQNIIKHLNSKVSAEILLGLSNTLYHINRSRGKELLQAARSLMNKRETNAFDSQSPSISLYAERPSLNIERTKAMLLGTEILYIDKPILFKAYQKLIGSTEPKVLHRLGFSLWGLWLSKRAQFKLHSGSDIKLVKSLIPHLNTQFDQEALSEFLSGISDIEMNKLIITRYTKSGHTLGNLVLNTYLKNLYRQCFFEECIKDKEPLYLKYPEIVNHKMVEHKQFKSTLDYTRFVYSNIEQRPLSLVGTMMFGEARIAPENVWKVYFKKQIETVNEKILTSLTISVITFYERTGKHLMWNGITAVQQCIMEVEKWTAKSSAGDNPNLLCPTNQLWLSYTQMLGMFGYTDLLMDLLERWVNLRHIPNERTLLNVFGYLPDEISDNLLRHVTENIANKVPATRMDNALHKPEINFDNDSLVVKWPWPTKSQVENFKKRLLI
ncbi:BA75_01532T0 [Komagataella pastoris]|uniref:BA75_01532T0 n=1 Tax=Komagataella pastoris TaxID=4922 RepID=A0A1B2J7E8_PICPA|nr:BA75_01532T0 [Komagataella pastoris]